MGQKKSDGRAIDITIPASQVVHFGEMYYVTGWTFIAMDEVGASDTVRTIAGAVTEEMWYIKFPSGINPAAGAYVYWADRTATFQDCGTNLQTTPGTTGDRPAAKVLVAKNAGGYGIVRAMN